MTVNPPAMALQAFLCRCILVLLPHFALPGGLRYPVPLASLAVLAALVHVACTLRVRIGAAGTMPRCAAGCCVGMSG